MDDGGVLFKKYIIEVKEEIGDWFLLVEVFFKFIIKILFDF